MSDKILQREYYFGEKDLFPEEITKGNILYDPENNGLYIDTDDERKQVNVQPDWNETNEASPSYIVNKPELGDILETASGWYLLESPQS